jgi:hypothetical protein
MVPTATARATASTVRVGDRVRLRFGGRKVAGTVVEDRGCIGVNGRRLLRVKLDLRSLDEPMELEVPAAELSQAE